MCCVVCHGKRYLVCTRMDGRKAIERCDECSTDTLTDEDAAKLAQQDGIECEPEYPCYVRE
jgi:hypothetical protein